MNEPLAPGSYIIPADAVTWVDLGEGGYPIPKIDTSRAVPIPPGDPLKRFRDAIVEFERAYVEVRHHGVEQALVDSVSKRIEFDAWEFTFMYRAALRGKQDHAKFEKPDKDILARLDRLIEKLARADKP